MLLMVSGLLLWTLVHWVPTLWPALKVKWQNRIGAGGYQGSFALLIVCGLVLLVLGWRQFPAAHVYQPVYYLKHPAMGLAVVGFVLMGAVNYSSRIKRFIRHPQLTGFVLWAVAHLLLNGDQKSLLVFGWLGLWALSEIVLINRRNHDYQPPVVVSWSKEVTGLLISFLVVAVFVWLHPYLSGRHLF